MASNFTISILRKDKNIHFNLSGDFDGSSASELIHLIRANCKDDSQVYIHTNMLTGKIHPFGQRIFHNNFRVLMKKSSKFTLTGKYADKFDLAASEFSRSL
jgi:hypothetical protein